MAGAFEYRQAEEIRDVFAVHGIRYLFAGHAVGPDGSRGRCQFVTVVVLAVVLSLAIAMWETRHLRTVLGW